VPHTDVRYHKELLTVIPAFRFTRMILPVN
jgi:hypothetical protein